VTAGGEPAARGGEEATGAAALVVARAPGDPAALAGLAPLLDAGRRAALQALLIRRAAAWAAAAAPGAAFVAVAGPGDVAVAGPGDVAVAGPGDVAVAGLGDVAVAGLSAVAALLPPGVRAFAADLATAVARIGRGPLLIARADCPQLGPVHAAAALDDLAAGCGVVFGATLEGDWYLAGLRDPRPELLTVADERAGGIAPVIRRARELGVEVGMLRHERVLATPEDAAALLADPLLDTELRAAIDA
jgi:hypothetical protein